MFNRVSPIKIALLLRAFAVFVGYIVASPVTWTALGVYFFIFFSFSLPLLLRWHHFLVIAIWNTNAVIYLLPGAIGFFNSDFFLFTGVLGLSVSLNRGWGKPVKEMPSDFIENMLSLFMSCGNRYFNLRNNG